MPNGVKVAERGPGPLLAVERLTVSLPRNMERAFAVEDVSFELRAGEILCIIGESGSGKSVTANAVMGLLAPTIRVTSGKILFKGQDITGAAETMLRGLRGRAVSMIFQDPLSALNPLMTVGDQIAEVMRAHNVGDRDSRTLRVLELLEEVGLPEPPLMQHQYPFRLSGGQRQRVMIAMALALDPEVLIADEPTTALDVTIQAQIIDLVTRLKDELGMAIIWITHDLGVVAGMAQRVLVMYAGEIVEEASVSELFAHPHHPYTEGLLAAMPTLGAVRSRLAVIPGTVPAPTRWPPGCRFHERCPYAWDRPEREHPPLFEVGRAHLSRCFLAEEPARRHVRAAVGGSE